MKIFLHRRGRAELTRNPSVDLFGDGVDDSRSVRVDALGLQPVPKLVAVLHGVHLRKVYTYDAQGPTTLEQEQIDSRTRRCHLQGMLHYQHNGLDYQQ